MLKINNTLTRKKEEFTPQKKSVVKMYTCGVTVYDDCHIGHGRSLYIFEVMRRYLEYRGFKVEFVRNITDVDDKIINRAREWAKKENISLTEAFDKVRKTYIDSYHEDLDLLKIPRSNLEPLATDNIPQMQEYIKKLIDKGLAYEADGSVYFSIRAFSSYGKLSGKRIDDLFESVRIESDPNKKDPLDFALWKKVKPDEPSWDSPWGRGRPGWHIECSVMSQRYLKTDTLDIHGGGRDLVFPHHENELAQSESLTGKPFAKYWIHHGLLTIDNQKMAKSLGNFVTIKDVLSKYPADVLKMFYLGGHYSSSMDFSWARMDEAKSAYERIVISRDKLDKYLAGKKIAKKTLWGTGELKNFEDEFTEAMDDDFNMPKGLAVLFAIVNACHGELASDDPRKDEDLAYARDVIEKITNIFALTFDHKQESKISDSEVENFIQQRLDAKKNKDYAKADSIRKDLESKGIILEDSKDGTQWRRKL